MRTGRLVWALLWALSIGGVARAADPREQQLAQALFDEGRQLMEQGRYAEACPKLAESQRLDPGGGTLLNLALCHEQERKLATAHAEYNEAMSLALRDGRTEREELARERIKAIEPRVPRVSVAIAAAAEVEGLEVRLDGLVLRRAAWGAAAMVDPGVHRVDATAPGRKAWSASVTVAENERAALEVPPLPPAAPPSGAEAPPARPPAPSSHANPAFYVTLAAGGVALAVSGITGLLALSANGVVKDGCTPARDFCKDQASIDAASRARTFAWISTGALAAGAIAAGALLFIPLRVRDRSANVAVAPTSGGVAMHVDVSF